MSQLVSRIYIYKKKKKEKERSLIEWHQLVQFISVPRRFLFFLINSFGHKNKNDVMIRQNGGIRLSKHDVSNMIINLMLVDDHTPVWKNDFSIIFFF